MTPIFMLLLPTTETADAALHGATRILGRQAAFPAIRLTQN